jgi:hypothetical protein
LIQVSIPDFDKVHAGQSEDNWIPACVTSEVVPLSRRILFLKPRGGHPINGVNDAWNSFMGDERMDSTYLPLMADTFPSMSDTLLRNGGLYDAHRIFQKIKEWVHQNPGVPCELHSSRKAVMQATLFNNTITLDMEFKRRMPREGVKWTFTRVATRLLEGGRMDLDITICDEKMKVLCLARQAVLVLEAQRKFQPEKQKSAL